MNDYRIMLLRLQCRREDKAFAPLVSFTFIVIAFPYKRTWGKKKKSNKHGIRIKRQ